MIAWLVSYPRSGNTLARLVLKQCLGFDTYSVYNDPLFKKRGIDSLLGQRDITDGDLWRMATGDQLNFVKTHRKHEDVPGKVVYIIRDGRDVYVSYAKYRVAFEGAKNYMYELERLVRSEAWGIHERTWRTNGIDRVLIYHKLSNDTVFEMNTVLNALQPSMPRQNTRFVPTQFNFNELHKKWPNFFRRGLVGSYRDEMPEEIQNIFWKSKIHQEVMKRYGFT